MRRCAALAAAIALCAAGSASAHPVVPAPQAPPGCDPLGTGNCLFPWPNDYFTDHGHLALTASMMPRNAAGVPIEPSDYNRADGFSPGQTIVLKVPGLDTPGGLREDRRGADHRSGAHLRPSPAGRGDQRAHGRRHLIWAELDSNAGSPAATALLIHPAKNFREGERYIVALRNLRDADGKPIAAPRAFQPLPGRDQHRLQVLRAPPPPHGGHLPAAQARGHQAPRPLPRVGLHVASERSLSSRMLSIRDRAFAELGDRNLSDLKVTGSAPKYTIDKVIDYTPAQQPNVRRRIEGHVTVPCYLDQPGCPPGSRFRLGPDGLPQRIPGNTYEAALHLQHPALGFVRQTGAPVALRARPVRRRGGGRRRQRRAARQREQRARLRRRLDRDVRGRPAQRARRAR